MRNYPWQPPTLECANETDISKLFGTETEEETSGLNFSLEQQGNVPCLIVTCDGKRYRFLGSEV